MKLERTRDFIKIEEKKNKRYYFKQSKFLDCFLFFLAIGFIFLYDESNNRRV